LPHMGTNDPNSPNAPSPKYSTKSDRSSKVGMTAGIRKLVPGEDPSMLGRLN
jgi:hypothetical protein